MRIDFVINGIKSNQIQRRLAKYLATIPAFKIKLSYQHGKENCMADFLSRNVHHVSISNVHDKNILMFEQEIYMIFQF